MNNKITFFHEELIRTMDWLKFAEQKFTLLSVYFGLSITFLSTNGGDLLSEIRNLECSYYDIFKKLIIIGLLLSLILGTYYLLKVVFPNLQNKSIKKSFFYFGHIAKMNVINFISDIKNLTENEIEDQILEQVHTNSCIANEKMKNIQTSQKYLFINVACLVLVILFL